mgnify:CR=1 FL=1
MIGGMSGQAAIEKFLICHARTPLKLSDDRFGFSGGGGAGSVLTNSGNWTVSTPTTQFNSDLKITPKDGRDAIVETNHHKINHPSDNKNMGE